MQEYALRVLVNLTYSKEAEVQQLAAQQGALGAVVGVLLAAPAPSAGRRRRRSWEGGSGGGGGGGGDDDDGDEGGDDDGEDGEGSEDGEDALELALTVLCNLATGSETNSRAIGSSTEACERLIALCEPGDEAADETGGQVRAAAAELLLALLGTREVRASLVRLGARRRLEQLAAWGGANATLVAKAAQALKEHVAEASGSLCS